MAAEFLRVVLWEVMDCFQTPIFPSYPLCYPWRSGYIPQCRTGPGTAGDSACPDTGLGESLTLAWTSRSWCPFPFSLFSTLIISAEAGWNTKVKKSTDSGAGNVGSYELHLVQPLQVQLGLCSQNGLHLSSLEFPLSCSVSTVDHPPNFTLDGNPLNSSCCRIMQERKFSEEHAFKEEKSSLGYSCELGKNQSEDNMSFPIHCRLPPPYSEQCC